MAGGMVKKDDVEKEPPPLSNEAIGNTVGGVLKKVGKGFIKGLTKLTQSDASKAAEAADAAAIEADKKKKAEKLDWMGNPKE